MSSESLQIYTIDSKLPAIARDTKLPGRYRELYNQLLQQGLREFPPIEGYETMHVMLMERAAYLFSRLKADEDTPDAIVDFKRYTVNFRAFIRVIESMLKEARSISAEVTFKHNFVRQVVEVIDRCIPNSEYKKLVVSELAKLAQS